jgi:hypothetical protein
MSWQAYDYDDLLAFACQAVGIKRPQVRVDSDLYTRMLTWPNMAVDRLAKDRDWPWFKRRGTVWFAGRDVVATVASVDSATETDTGYHANAGEDTHTVWEIVFDDDHRFHSGDTITFEDQGDSWAEIGDYEVEWVNRTTIRICPLDADTDIVATDRARRSDDARWGLLPGDFRSFVRNASIVCRTKGYSGLGKVQMSAIDQLRNAGTTSGIPRLCAVGERDPIENAYRLEIHPQTASLLVYDIFYHRQPVSMSANSDTPDVPESCHDTLKWLCKLVAREDENNVIDENLHVLYQQELERAWLEERQKHPVAAPLNHIIQRGGFGLPRGRNVSLSSNASDPFNDETYYPSI